MKKRKLLLKKLPDVKPGEIIISHQGSATAASNQILAEIDAGMNPHPNWLLVMKNRFTKAVTEFNELIKEYGYNSFQELCYNIKVSIAVVKQFLSKWEVDFDEKAETTLEVLQGLLVQAFKKAETHPTSGKW
jgi:hypothetical protein